MLQLTPQGRITSVNEESKNTAPGGAMDHIGHLPMHLIHAFSEALECANIFQTNWDIKDGFRRIDFKEVEKWNFCYVLPKSPGMQITLMVPT